MLVCLHSGVFLRSQHIAFIGRTNPALANRFIRGCRKHAVEQSATRNVSCYSWRIDIAHKGLLVFFERSDARRLPAALAPRIRRILSDLDAAIQPET